MDGMLLVAECFCHVSEYKIYICKRTNIDPLGTKVGIYEDC